MYVALRKRWIFSTAHPRVSARLSVLKSGRNINIHRALDMLRFRLWLVIAQERAGGDLKCFVTGAYGKLHIDLW